MFNTLTLHARTCRFFSCGQQRRFRRRSLTLCARTYRFKANKDIRKKMHLSLCAPVHIGSDAVDRAGVKFGLSLCAPVHIGSAKPPNLFLVLSVNTHVCTVAKAITTLFTSDKSGSTTVFFGLLRREDCLYFAPWWGQVSYHLYLFFSIHACT